MPTAGEEEAAAAGTEELEPLFDYSRVQPTIAFCFDDTDLEKSDIFVHCNKRRKVGNADAGADTVEGDKADEKGVKEATVVDLGEEDWLPPPPKPAVRAGVQTDSTLQELRNHHTELVAGLYNKTFLNKTALSNRTSDIMEYLSSSDKLEQVKRFWNFSWREIGLYLMFMAMVGLAVIQRHLEIINELLYLLCFLLVIIAVMLSVKLKKQELAKLAESAQDILEKLVESAQKDLEVKKPPEHIILDDEPPEPEVEKAREKIVITIQDKDGQQQFRVYKDEKFDKLLRAYAKKAKLTPSDLTFVFDGDKINPASTPEDLGLEDDDMIEVRHKPR